MTSDQHTKLHRDQLCQLCQKIIADGLTFSSRWDLIWRSRSFKMPHNCSVMVTAFISSWEKVKVKQLFFSWNSKSPTSSTYLLSCSNTSVQGLGRTRGVEGVGVGGTRWGGGRGGCLVQTQPGWSEIQWGGGEGGCLVQTQPGWSEIQWGGGEGDA